MQIKKTRSSSTYKEINISFSISTYHKIWKWWKPKSGDNLVDLSLISTYFDTDLVEDLKDISTFWFLIWFTAFWFLYIWFLISQPLTMVNIHTMVKKFIQDLMSISLAKKWLKKLSKQHPHFKNPKLFWCYKNLLQT